HKLSLVRVFSLELSPLSSFWGPPQCDQIEARYQKAKAYTDKLTQSILAKAFRGELVPQDPNDEPAEALLERIRAEKEAATAKPQKTTKKRGKKASSPQQTIPGIEQA
ncbi:hypothetical protein, partial [Synechocystis sp. CACIAM 05]|uniref:hypothetical protein n=1 Tax=Synechocystis sp. CACIAM 05 TaxID=1933929 RepID=UPI00138E7772